MTVVEVDGLIRILCVNLSSTGSVVLEKEEKRFFGVFTDREIDKHTHLKKKKN